MKRLSSSRADRYSYAEGSALFAIERRVAITKPHVIPPMSMRTTATSCSRALLAVTGTSP